MPLALGPLAGAMAAAAALTGCAGGFVKCAGQDECTVYFARLWAEVDWSIERRPDGSKVVRYSSSPGAIDLGSLAKALTPGPPGKDKPAK